MHQHCYWEVLPRTNLRDGKSVSLEERQAVLDVWLSSCAIGDQGSTPLGHVKHEQESVSGCGQDETSMYWILPLTVQMGQLTSDTTDTG